ncbi:MAG: hypothetical protein V1742_13040, partial [Pseudomonadota bacterium]
MNRAGKLSEMDLEKVEQAVKVQLDFFEPVDGP